MRMYICLSPPAFIDVMTTLIQITLDGTNILTCEAVGRPTPQIHWEGTWLDTGMVVTLLSNGTEAFTITNTLMGISTTDQLVSSVLEFNPESAPFESPVCIISNGVLTNRVTTLDFTDLDGESSFVSLSCYNYCNFSIVDPLNFNKIKFYLHGAAKKFNAVHVFCLAKSQTFSQ